MSTGSSTLTNADEDFPPLRVVHREQQAPAAKTQPERAPVVTHASAHKLPIPLQLQRSLHPNPALRTSKSARRAPPRDGSGRKVYRSFGRIWTLISQLVDAAHSFLAALASLVAAAVVTPLFFVLPFLAYWR